MIDAGLRGHLFDEVWRHAFGEPHRRRHPPQAGFLEVFRDRWQGVHTVLHGLEGDQQNVDWHLELQHVDTVARQHEGLRPAGWAAGRRFRQQAQSFAACSCGRRRWPVAPSQLSRWSVWRLTAVQRIRHGAIPAMFWMGGDSTSVSHCSADGGARHMPMRSILHRLASPLAAGRFAGDVVHLRVAPRSSATSMVRRSGECPRPGTPSGSDERR